VKKLEKGRAVTFTHPAGDRVNGTLNSPKVKDAKGRLGYYVQYGPDELFVYSRSVVPIVETLSVTPDIGQYKRLSAKEAKLGRLFVVVSSVRSENRYGTWATGFKFSTIEYGVLTYHPTKDTWLISANHGVTWHSTIAEAKRSKGKVVLYNSKTEEFAFNGIQRINRDYDPNYKWRA